MTIKLKKDIPDFHSGYESELSRLRQRVAELEDSLAGKRKALAESRALYAQHRDCCKQRGERMKEMRYSNNSFMDWFDETGEPL